VIGGTGGPEARTGFREVLRYDPATGGWTATGAVAVGRADFAAAELADGRVLVAGGVAQTDADGGGLTATAEALIP